MGLGNGHIGQPSGFKKGFGSGGFAPPNQSPPTAPSQVTGLSALSDTDTIINLSWTAPSNGGSAITGYFIERKIGAGAWATLVADTGTTTTTYSNTGLTMSTLYTYRVSAINSVGTGSASSEANATTFDTVASGYFTRAGITDVTERASANTFITTCRANANVWASITSGAVYLVSPTNYASATHNTMSSSFQLTGGVPPAFSSTDGFDFDGLTQYLQSGFISSSHTTTGKKYTTIYSNKLSGTAVNGEIWGSSVSATQQWAVRPNSSGGNALTTDNSSAASFTPVSGNSNGTFIHNSYNDLSREILRNGVSLGTTVTLGGGSRPNIEQYLGARNSAGTASLFYPCKLVGFIQTTTYLTQAESIILANALDTYNSTVISGGR